MSDFMKNQLEAARKRLNDCEDTAETRNTILLLDVAIAGLDDADVVDPLLETVSEDIEKLKKQRSVLKNPIFWTILLAALTLLSSAIGYILVLVLEDSLKDSFAKKEIETQYEERFKKLERRASKLEGFHRPFSKHGTQQSFPQQTQLNLNN
jgi:hypothetical protein